MPRITTSIARYVFDFGIIAALTCATSACDFKKSAQDRRLEEERAAKQADLVLLNDIAQASAEFGRRLRRRVSTQDGMVLVSDIPELATIHGFPANVPWSISCSKYFGLSVTFGSGTSNADNVVDVQLSRASMSDEQCMNLVPDLGRQVIIIVGFAMPNQAANSFNPRGAAQTARPLPP
jgi:hypothetical protein